MKLALPIQKHKPQNPALKVKRPQGQTPDWHRLTKALKKGWKKGFTPTRSSLPPLAPRELTANCPGRHLVEQFDIV